MKPKVVGGCDQALSSFKGAGPDFCGDDLFLGKCSSLGHKGDPWQRQRYGSGLAWPRRLCSWPSTFPRTDTRDCESEVLFLLGLQIGLM